MAYHSFIHTYRLIIGNILHGKILPYGSCPIEDEVMDHLKTTVTLQQVENII